MKATIIITLIIIAPILGDQEQEQVDYYDADEYFDAPILKPSEITVEELVDPNFSINPESTLTFNYDKVINGQSPQPIEKRKETVQHYFRVRKPAVKRVIYHIKRYKNNEGKDSTPFYDVANIEKEINNADLYITPQALPNIYEEKQSFPENQHEETNSEINKNSHTTTEVYSKSLNLEDPQTPKNYNTDLIEPVLISEKQEAVTNISPTTPVDSYIENQNKLPRLRIRGRQKIRKNEQTRITEKLVQPTIPTMLEKNNIIVTSSTTAETNLNTDTSFKKFRENISGQKRAKGRKWLQSTATPTTTTQDLGSTSQYKNNKLPIPVMRFRQKWPVSAIVSTQTPPIPMTTFSSQKSTEEDTDTSTEKIETDIIKSENSKVLFNDESSSSKQDESLLATTLLPGSYNNSKNNGQPQIKPRILRRKFQKVSSAPLSSNVRGRRNRILATTELSTLSKTTNPQNMSSEVNPDTQKTEATTEVTTEQYSKKPRHFGRKRLHPRPTTNKPEVNNEILSVNTESRTVPNLENETRSPRMRYRNRFRKTRLYTPKVNEITPATETIIISTSAIPSTQTTAWSSWEPESTEKIVSEEDIKVTSENSESSQEEKPKGRFSNDNLPPPVPTLSPWYDGYGK